MKYKILFSSLGLIASLFFLKMVDPLFKNRAFERQRSHPEGDIEREAFLKRAVEFPPWRDFEPGFPPKGTVIAETKRILDHNNLINTKYSVISPNSVVKDTVLLRAEGGADFEKLFGVVYSIDSYSRRKTAERNQSDHGFGILLLGCSFTFGVGVEDQETFSSVLRAGRSSINSYNLGIRGAGPNDFLDDFTENPQRYEGMPDKRGVIIYTAITDQLERAICHTRCYSEESSIRLGNSRTLYRINKSKYEFDDQGNLARKGTFLESDLPWGRVKNILFQSNIASLLYRELFPFPRDEDIWLFAKMIEKIKMNMSQKFPHDFYFAFFPEHHFTQKELLFRYLRELGVEYFDFTRVRFNKTLRGRAYYPYDRHPTALGQYAYGKLIEQELRIRYRDQYN